MRWPAPQQIINGNAHFAASHDGDIRAGLSTRYRIIGRFRLAPKMGPDTFNIFLGEMLII